MKPGYIINNLNIYSENNCIVVANYHPSNTISNYPFNLKHVQDIRGCFDIGIWKLKTKK